MTVIEQRIVKAKTPNDVFAAFAVIDTGDRAKVVERINYELALSKDRKEIFYKLMFLRFITNEATYEDAATLLKSIRYEK